MAYIQFDISSQSLYAILYMLLASLLVLCIYAFVVAILVLWNIESPPERVNVRVNTSVAGKGLKDDRNKSYSHPISGTH